MPVIAAIRAALPDMPISVDTTKPAVAEAALAAGADLINDVWGVGDDDALARVAADHGVPLVVMHNRAEPRYRTSWPSSSPTSRRRSSARSGLGVPWDDLIVDPGFGFGKTPEHNLELLRDLDALRMLGRPILLGTRRKSTLGRVLDLPAEERLEATLATTALGIAAGVDIVRVHDVEANVRAARMADAIVRPAWRDTRPEGGHRERPHRPREHAVPGPPRGTTTTSSSTRSRSRSMSSLWLNLQPAGVDDDLDKTVDYGKVYEAVRQIVKSTSYRLLEALAEAISHELLAGFPIDEVGVRLRKPAVQLGGPLDYAGVEIRRQRA